MVLQEINIIQATVQEKDAKIEKLQHHLSHQEVLIEQQTTDLFRKSDLLNDFTIFVEQLIAAEEERQEHGRRMRLSEREADRSPPEVCRGTKVNSDSAQKGVSRITSQ